MLTRSLQFTHYIDILRLLTSLNIYHVPYMHLHISSKIWKQRNLYTHKKKYTICYIMIQRTHGDIFFANLVNPNQI